MGNKQAGRQPLAITDSQAFSLLSQGVREWVSSQRWPAFRDIQSASISALLADQRDGHPAVTPYSSKNNLVISAGTSSGKALTDDTPVLTTDGWKPIGNLTIYDRVYSQDGRHYRVLGVFPQGTHRVWRVRLADGRTIDCNSQHIWTVFDNDPSNGIDENTPIENLPTMTTEEIVEAGLDITDERGEIIGYRFGIPTSDFLESSTEWEDSISAGEFGIALRNGSRTVIPQSADTIPLPQRCRLLGGVVDSFGYINNGQPYIGHFGNEKLEMEVLSLCRALGLTPLPFPLKDGTDGYVISNQRFVAIADIELLDSYEPMTCISVDSPDHTFIAKDYIVTHNTEAAFMPAITLSDMYAADHRDERFVSVLYVAPLKALINDQYRRMCTLASRSGIPVYMWHSDAPAGQKAELLREHDGILMTTPESLESFLMNRGEWCARYLHPLVTIVDEYHAFLGQGRGKQLMSLLARVDALCVRANRRPMSRIALSATLSELDIVAEMLDPDDGAIVIDGTGTTDEQIISVKSFPKIESVADGGYAKIDYVGMAKEIISESGDDKTLTFCKSRSDVESMTTAINETLGKDGIAPRAMPHHGLLSKQTREELEHRLVSTDKPTMAIATITLELGIDIGDIAKVLQVESATSVASLRQRMGRSGRRNGIRDMEILVSLSDEESDMQENLITSIAEIELMNAGWFEPPNARRCDISVLASEMLSIVKQAGMSDADTLWETLCLKGAFRNVDGTLFDMVLDDMIENGYLEEHADSSSYYLLLGQHGEREVNDWRFYASFADQECYTVKQGTKTIGQITPPESALSQLANGGEFKLAGKYWKVLSVDQRGKTVSVKQTNNKAKFLTPVSSGGGDVAGRIKRERISLLSGKLCGYEPDYLDDKGLQALSEARLYAKKHGLNGLGLILYDSGDIGSEDQREKQMRIAAGYKDDAQVCCKPPVDTATLNGIYALMTYADSFDSNGGRRFDLSNIPLYRLNELVNGAVQAADKIRGREEKLIDDTMLADLRNREKNNGFFKAQTLAYAYGREIIDIDGALGWLHAFQRFWNLPVKSRNKGSNR